MDLEREIAGLYGRAATELPEDVVIALEAARKAEDGALAKGILARMLDNARMAMEEKKPICQDTGMPNFYVRHPAGRSQRELVAIIGRATDDATREVPLRPNAVDCLTGRSLGNRPVIHFEESDDFGVTLFLKGGGSENVSAVYRLPDPEMKAGRDLDGVARCILDAVFRAQGRGCPPYVIGAAIGGSLEEAARLSKMQLLRRLDDHNPVGELGDLERDALRKINRLGIGPMGLGGRTTALAVKIGCGIRHPASYIVGVSIGCWCLRRRCL